MVLGEDMIWFNLQYDPLLSGLPVLILFYAEILGCEHIDMFISTFTDLIYYTTSDADFTIRIILIYNVDCDSWITRHVPLLHSTYGCINQDEAILMINSDRCYLR